ncbi:MAG: (d)CMP kinase [Lachnospiraceae bacterium]
MKHINIAIDGPAGAGKSTIAKAVAKKRDIVYVDTGAMYRAIGLYILRNGIAPDDIVTIEKELPNIDVSILYEDGEQLVLLNGENVNSVIRTQEVGNMASATSVHKKVREKLVELQQALAAKTSVVMDGRDIGTAVLPDADVKIYLTASVEVRAKRRFDELTAKGENCDYEVLKQEIAARDERDMTRENSPLRKAEDAVEVDTSDLSIEEAVAAIEQVILRKTQMIG